MEAPQLLILKNVHIINTRLRSTLHNYYVPQINTILARNSTQYKYIYIFNKQPNRLKEGIVGNAHLRLLLIIGVYFRIFEQNDLCTSAQHCLRRGRSTTSALLSLAGVVTDALKKRVRNA